MKKLCRRYITYIAVLAMAAVMLAVLAGCGGSSSSGSDAQAPEIDGLTYSSAMELKYAEQFNVFYYEDGYAVVDIKADGRYLIVPEGKAVPDGLDESITVLTGPVGNIYDAATASVALFDAMDAMDSIRMVSVDKEGWTFDSVKNALDSGDVIYAGKYSAPDYETLMNEDCELAVESTMILHSPEVKEMLESLDIPVLIDYSSYESNPMGRTEWIKLYGVLTGHEEEAETFFNKQLEAIAALEDVEATGKTVAYFYISTDGKAVVRSSTDYIPAMIKMAGGEYVFTDLTDESGASSIDMSIEQFYKTAKDADIIIYNGSIDSSVASLDDLKAKNEIMSKFKAVKNGNCWCTGSAVYQRTDLAADMIMDIGKIIADEEPENGFITKLK
ncbi:MAG: ABC transporter substrate-binding protein [Lentihominibacter sp.]